MSNPRVRAWSMGIGVVTLWLAGCQAASTAPAAKTSRTASRPAGSAPATASAMTAPGVTPPSAPSPQPTTAPSATSLAPCPKAVQAELDQLATCLHQAITTRQREPEAQPLGAFLEQASLPGKCAGIARDAAGAALVDRKPVAVTRTESHDNYGEGHTAFLITYRLSLPHCRHSATTTVDRHIGGRP